MVDAINEGNHRSLVEELGDVLLQVVMHAQLLSETTDFDMKDVVSTIYQSSGAQGIRMFFGSLELVDSKLFLSTGMR